MADLIKYQDIALLCYLHSEYYIVAIDTGPMVSVSIWNDLKKISAYSSRRLKGVNLIGVSF